MTSLNLIVGVLLRREYTSLGAPKQEEYPMHIVEPLGGSIFRVFGLFFIACHITK